MEAKKRKLWKRLYTDLNRQAEVDLSLQGHVLVTSTDYWVFTNTTSLCGLACKASCHRAVDDLYTLAEMDGNLWQARNIVQLLDESTADFRQVSS